MANWFYAAGDQRVGPVSAGELKRLADAGAIGPETLVWTDGAADWAPARRVKGLFAPEVPVAVEAAPLVGAGSTLQYASAGLIDGSVAPVPFAPPVDDEGPFHKLGGTFVVGKQQWTGKALVSPRAIYLHKVARPNRAAYGVGGLVGVALAAATASADDLTRSCDITELPDNLRQQFDPKRKRTKGDIIVLNQGAMSLVKTTGWSNQITPHVGPERFPITCGTFRRGKARAFMRDNGWTLDLTTQPTEAPTHGRGYGLDDETVRERTHKSFWKRLGYAILAIVIFVLIVFLRVWADSHR